jgi:hypothetical protein
MYYLSDGNMVMKGVLIWNIPSRTTCPGATPLCKKVCYAVKAERLWKNTLPCRKENLDCTKDKHFVENMRTIIRAELLKSKKPITHFRIHESGDFYNQKYLDDWKAICSYFKDIKFLAFTKSFHLNFNPKPKNLEILLSVWEDTDLSTIPKGTIGNERGFPLSFTGMKGWNSIKCNGGENKCNLCNFKCWDLSKLKKNVWGLIH